MFKQPTFVVAILSVFASLAFTPAVANDVNAMRVTKTLPVSGADVVVTLLAQTPVSVHEVLTDNNPTNDAGLCSFTAGDPSNGAPDICTDSDFRLVRVKIGGSDYRPGGNPRDIAENDSLAIRALLDQTTGSLDTALPLRAGESLQLFFDTDNGNNDVKIGVTVGFTGRGVVY